MQACPVHTQAGRYVTLIAQGRYEDAYSYARAPNPFASTTRLAGLLSRSKLPAALLGIAILLAGARVAAQVSPAEIRNPELRQLQTTYLPQLKELHQIVSSRSFPFPFVLSRYVGLDPAQQIGTDTRGIEFVHFQKRIVLKITGNYNAAFNADQLAQNERATRVFTDVIVPVLSDISRTIPSDVPCDGIGFEVSYHVRRTAKGYDYEGKELLVLLFKPPDAFRFMNVPSDQARQDILNRSEIYLNGHDFGLALNSPDPLDPEELQRSDARPPVPPPPTAAAAANAGARLATTNPRLLTPDPIRTAPVPPGTLAVSGPPSGITAAVSTEPGAATARATETLTVVPPSGTATPAAADQVQAKYQQQLDAFAATGQAKFHFVDYAPPMFAVFQNRVVLQITVRNTRQFDASTTSIYKRAAQAFDLFLAPQLKDILAKMPSGTEFDTVDISVVNPLKTTAPGSSEAIEFVCPLGALHRFAEAEITNQDLINQSVVLVNGVRIALNLQLVE